MYVGASAEAVSPCSVTITAYRHVDKVQRQIQQTVCREGS